MILILILVVKAGSPNPGLYFLHYDCNFNSSSGRLVVLIQDCISFTMIVILILVVEDGSPHPGLYSLHYDCNFNSSSGRW